MQILLSFTLGIIPKIDPSKKVWKLIHQEVIYWGGGGGGG